MSDPLEPLSFEIGRVAEPKLIISEMWMTTTTEIPFVTVFRIVVCHCGTRCGPGWFGRLILRVHRAIEGQPGRHAEVLG